MFLEIQNRYNWLDCNEWKLPRIVSFYIFLTCARLNNLIPDNVMGLKILKRKCACGSSFSMITWKLLSLKKSTTLSHQAVLSAEIIREQSNAEAEKNFA